MAEITWDDFERVELRVGLVVAVVNFPLKQIGKMMSECLVTGFHDAEGRIMLCTTDADVPLGTRLC